MGQQSNKVKVLFVDDDVLWLAQAKIFLEKLNDLFNVKTTTSPQKVLHMLQNDRFDIVIADYKMPCMTGLELLKRVRAQGNSIPFIIFTGKGSEKGAIRALNFGADYYVLKEGDPQAQYSHLAQAIIKLVRHS